MVKATAAQGRSDHMVAGDKPARFEHDRLIGRGTSLLTWRDKLCQIQKQKHEPIGLQ